MLILGVHSSHDASACLMRNGEILVAIEKERLVRSKHATGYEGLRDVVEYCLDFAGFSLGEVDHIVVQDATHRLGKPLVAERELRIGHHTAHAWAAAGLSGFTEAAVLVIDCEGSYLKELPESELNTCTEQGLHCIEKESAYIFSDGDLRPLRKWTSAVGDSIMTGTEGIGAAYWFLSQLIFGRDQNDSKVMGMSAYGTPEDRYRGVLLPAAQGGVEVSKNWIFSLDHIPRCDLETGFEAYAALTATVQQELEDAVLHKAKWLRQVTGMNRLCYAGGVALNCVANSKLARAGLFDVVFVPFGAGDSTLSIGCAYYAHHRLGANAPSHVPVHSPSPFLGRAYDTAETDAQLAPYCAAHLIDEGSPMRFSEVAERLAEGAIVGWVQGRSEFGPRALGNRSLLADPRRADIRETLNQRVKLREPYRPFGPVVLAEEADAFFEEVNPGAFYMQFVAKVRPERCAELPSVVHQDGTARVQLVSRDSNPRLHDLLRHFQNRTGIPVLLNTSFNIAEPIVETPGDAAKCFVCSGIDLLVINDRIYRRTSELVANEADLFAVPPSDLCLIFHHDLELICRNQLSFAIQPLTGREVFYKEGYRIHQYRIDEAPISRALFDVLAAMEPAAQKVVPVGASLARAGLRKEAFQTLHRNRIASFVDRRPRPGADTYTAAGRQLTVLNMESTRFSVSSRSAYVWEADNVTGSGQGPSGKKKPNKALRS